MSESHLGESLAALSQFLVGDRTVDDTLQRIADLALHAVVPADMVGMTMLLEGQKQTGVCTDRAMAEIDEAQYSTGEGPCLRAFEERRTVVIESTLLPGPFEAFRHKAAARGILSTLSVPMIRKRSLSER